MAKEIIKDLTEQELKDKLHDYSNELRKINIQISTNQIENKKRKWFVKKRIAQIKTILNEYQLGIRKTKLEKK